MRFQDCHENITQSQVASVILPQSMLSTDVKYKASWVWRANTSLIYEYELPLVCTIRFEIKCN